MHGSSGVQSLSFSVDGALLFTTGKERDFFVWNIAGRPFEKAIASELAENPQLEAVDTVEDNFDNSVPFFSELLAAEIAKQEAGDIEKIKHRTRGRLAEISEKLQAMLEANAKAPELEQLDRDEFVLDVEKKERFEKDGKEAADQMRENARL